MHVGATVHHVHADPDTHRPSSHALMIRAESFGLWTGGSRPPCGSAGGGRPIRRDSVCMPLHVRFASPDRVRRSGSAKRPGLGRWCRVLRAGARCEPPWAFVHGRMREHPMEPECSTSKRHREMRFCNASDADMPHGHRTPFSMSAECPIIECVRGGRCRAGRLARYEIRRHAPGMGHGWL